MENVKTEMEKLIDYLQEKYSDGSKFKVHVCRMDKIHDYATQVVVYDADGRTRLWDAICHKYSYGYGKGLLEVMENTKDNYILTDEERECDDVLGWLTAEDIIERLES